MYLQGRRAGEASVRVVLIIFEFWPHIGGGRNPPIEGAASAVTGELAAASIWALVFFARVGFPERVHQCRLVPLLPAE